jgi:hypothetical protein
MRPTGVTLSANFEFLRGALVVIYAAGAFLIGGLAARVAALGAEGNTLQRVLSGSGKLIGLTLLLYAILQIASGVGLLMMQNWGRLLAIFFSALGILALLPRILHHRPFGSVFGLLNLAVFIYLLLPQTRAYFLNKQIPGQTQGGNSSAVSTI